MVRTFPKLWTIALFVGVLVAHGASELLAVDLSSKPITEDERRHVVQQLTEAVHTKDQGKFESLTDEEAYVSVAAKGYRVPDQTIDDLRRSSKEIKSLTIHYKIAQRAYSANGAYDFLKAIPASNQLPDRLVFRVLDRNGVPSYQAWWLARLTSGEVRIIDVTESVSGYSNSENLVPFLEAKQAEQSLPTVSAEEQEAIDFLQLYREGKRLIVNGQHAKAVEKLDAIAPRFRKLTLTRLICLDALPQTDLARTFSELTELAEVESCRISIAYRRMKIALPAADQDKATIPVVLAAVNELEKTVEDPYLAVVKAAMLIKAGKPGEAKEEMTRALTAMPDSLHVRISAVSASLQEGDFQGVIPQLERFDKDFPEWIGKYLKYIDGYSAFKKSEAGKAWLDQRKAAQK